MISSSSNNQKIYDFCIVGGGFAGLVAAKNALRNNLSVALVEKRMNIGGTCLLEGCIPSKFLLNVSEKFDEIKKGKLSKMGITCDSAKINMEKVMMEKEKLISEMSENNLNKLKSMGCEIFHGFGKVKSPNEIEVIFSDNILSEPNNGKLLIKCKNIIICTGTEPKQFPGNEIKIDGENIFTSKNVLESGKGNVENKFKVPEKLMIIGGGYIGLEMGSFYNRMGSEVTIVDFCDKIMGDLDEEISHRIKNILEKQGINFMLNTTVVSSVINSKEKSSNNNYPNIEVSLVNLNDGNKKVLLCDKILVAVGRKPMTRNIGLEELGIKFDKEGKIHVNENLQTNVENIYALGDSNNMGMPLAHKAEDEALALFDKFLKGKSHLDYNIIPRVVFTYPEISSVGKTEEDCRRESIPYKIGVCEMKNNPRGKCTKEDEGCVKVIAHKETNEILGVHIISPAACEQIIEGVLCLHNKTSVETIRRLSHFHPSYSEAFKEAAEIAYRF